MTPQQPSLIVYVLEMANLPNARFDAKLTFTQAQDAGAIEVIDDYRLILGLNAATKKLYPFLVTANSVEHFPKGHLLNVGTGPSALFYNRPFPTTSFPQRLETKALSSGHIQGPDGILIAPNDIRRATEEKLIFFDILTNELPPQDEDQKAQEQKTQPKSYPHPQAPLRRGNDRNISRQRPRNR